MLQIFCNCCMNLRHYISLMIAIEQCEHRQAREPYAWACLNCAFFRVLLALTCLINFFSDFLLGARWKHWQLTCMLARMFQTEIDLLACNTGQIYSIYVILALKISKCITFWANIRLKIYRYINACACLQICLLAYMLVLDLISVAELLFYFWIWHPVKNDTSQSVNSLA